MRGRIRSTRTALPAAQKHVTKVTGCAVAHGDNQIPQADETREALMLIVVLASTMTAATLMATAFGLYEEAERSRLHAESDRGHRFQPVRRLPVDSRDRPVDPRNR